MKLTLMDSLKFTFPHTKPPQNLRNPLMLVPVKTPPKPITTITYGLRGGPRKPLWRSRVLSTEAIQAVQSVKLAKSTTSKLHEVFNNRVSRFIKTDLLDALGELLRQNELELSLKVFDFLREEV